MTKLKSVPAACSAPHRGALERVRANLKARFLERDEIVDGLLAAVLCGQHVLLLGPPGTAKSATVNALVESIDGAQSFTWLLTKFTTPEEVFGPISLKALQQDRFARIPAGKLPEAHVGFLDETFKANSAILNALLTLANERQFHNDGKVVQCPLITLVGASNELPGTDDLEALFDRFLLRFWVRYLTDESSVRTLLAKNPPNSRVSISLADLELCQREVMTVAAPDEIFDAVIAIKEKTEEKGFQSSDRRWRLLIDLLRAFAYLAGEDAVNEDHLDVLTDALWRQPKERPMIASTVGAVGNPLNVRATEILDAAKEVVSKLGRPSTEADAKADWLRSASLVESRLTDMEKELADLAQRNRQRNLRRLRDALGAIGAMKADVTRRVAQLYNL